MKIRVIRPDRNKSGEYLIALDESVLQLIEDGILAQVGELWGATSEHSSCDISNAQGCRVSSERLLRQFETLEAAAVLGKYPSDCSEDLRESYDSLRVLMDALHQIRYLQANADARSAYEEQDALMLLASIRETPQPVSAEVVPIDKKTNKSAR